MNSQKLCGLTDIPRAIGQHALNVLPFDTCKAGYRNRRLFPRQFRAKVLIRRENLVHVDGFAEVMIRAELQCLQRRRNAAVSRKNDQSGCCVERLERLNEIETADVRHLEIEQNKVRTQSAREFQSVWTICIVGFPP